MLLQELALEGRSGFPSPCAVPLPLASPRLSQTRPRRGAGLSHDLGTHTGVAAEPQREGNALVCPPEPLCAPGSSLPAALPPVSTDQPLSRGAPAAPLHQEISSQAQERQQQPRCDQGDQRLLGRVPVAPRALLFKGFYSKLEKKKKKTTKESREWDKQEMFASAAQASNNAAPHLLGKAHVNKAGLCCPSPAPALAALTSSQLIPSLESPVAQGIFVLWSTPRGLEHPCARLSSLCVLQLCIYTLRDTRGSAPRAKGSLRGALGGGTH